MNTTVDIATLDDLSYIESLSKRESKSLGFIPKVRYEASILGRRIREKSKPKCNDKLYICKEDGDHVGFVLGSISDNGVKINQICIQEDARLIERGKLLLNAMINYGVSNGRYDFSCGCADDLESNYFWKAMGWKKILKRNGISYKSTWKETSGRVINIYVYESELDPRIKLFQLPELFNCE